MISYQSRLLALYSFSTSAAVAQKTYAKFQERYTANAEIFRQKMNQSKKSGDQIKKTTQKVYVHPFHNQHKPISYSFRKRFQLESDLFGAQQVSPHYENFAYSRRYALMFVGGGLFLKYMATADDFYYFAQPAIKAWMYIFAMYYFNIQLKKSFFMPMLARFYTKIEVMQMTNLVNYFNENAEAYARQQMNVAKGQIEYKMVHNEYAGVRNQTLLNFLINEQIALKNHIYERAESILKQAEYIEKINKQKIITSVMSQTLKSVDAAYQKHKQSIEKDMFKLALNGIAQGRMDYAKDPILPYVVETINGIVKKFSTISEQEQSKLIEINQDQLQSIRSSDVRARDQYIKAEPKIDGSLKTNETVSRIISGWGTA